MICIGPFQLHSDGVQSQNKCHWTQDCSSTVKYRWYVHLVTVNQSYLPIIVIQLILLPQKFCQSNSVKSLMNAATWGLRDTCFLCTILFVFLLVWNFAVHLENSVLILKRNLKKIIIIKPIARAQSVLSGLNLIEII